MIAGKPLSVAAAAEAGAAHLSVNLLVSADERTLLATLVHRGWTPAPEKLNPEVAVLLAGRPPDLDLEHAGAARQRRVAGTEPEDGADGRDQRARHDRARIETARSGEGQPEGEDSHGWRALLGALGRSALP